MKTASNILLIACALFATTVVAGEHVDQTIKAPGDGTVQIENLAGSITVSAWDRNEVRVEGELDDRVERLEFENEGNFTRVKVIYPRNLRGNVEGTNLNITVPATSRLEVGGVSSEVDVRGVSGTVRVDTVSGNISVDNATNDYSLESVSGNIRLEGTQDDARVKASTVSGDLRLGDIQGELDAGSVSGDISVKGGELTRVEAANTSGDIDVRANFADAGSYRFKSISGNIVLGFENAPQGTFDITTFSGGIDGDFGPEPQRTSRYSPGMELKFREGDAAAEFRANTLSGDISLRKE
ncbi:MAG TPA: DUF4097 family beta strand repeat-containing protein [Gammaproteobacteria bacterium]